MPVELTSSIKEQESAQIVDYFEIYDYLGGNNNTVHFRYCSYHADVYLFDYFYPTRSALYRRAGIKRSRLNRDNALSVDSITLSFNDPDGVVFTRFTSNPREIDTLVGGKLACRRAYLGPQIMSSRGGVADFARNAARPYYKNIFFGRVSSFSYGQKGVVSIKASDDWLDWNLSINKRTYSRMCGFMFKGFRCGYNGDANFCDKTYAHCNELGNSSNYGGFRNIDEVVKSGVPFV